jgi:large subunit ribosomal protein L1
VTQPIAPQRSYKMAEAKKRASPAKAKKEAEVVTEAVAESAAPEVVVETEAVEVAPEIEAPAAKAGKRSAKAQKETEEKQEKEARKASSSASTTDKPQKKPTRSKVERAGKKYREVAALVDKSKTYTLAEAMDLATKTSSVKFDATVELHVNLGVDPRQADQNVRDMVTLPAGTGKSVRIAVFAEAEDAKTALAAGANIAGIDEVIALLEKEQLDFDVLISTPMLMARLGKYARMLGPRGLMPNPKSGTVTTDVAKAVTEAKAGKVEYRVDQAGIIHLGIGKVSFGAQKLNQNGDAVMSSIRAAKPASLKGTYIKAIHVSTTMGPSIKVVI